MAKTVAPIRASGLTAADEIAEQEGKSITEPLGPERGDVELPLTGGPATRPEDTHTSLTPVFSRMRTDWHSPDRQVIASMRSAVDAIVQQRFAEVFELFYQIYELVRVPVVDKDTGQVRTDTYGLPEWQRGPTGAYIEDWPKLTHGEAERFLYQITTGLFRWQQTAADIWGEAMFGKASFEEAFAHGYQELPGDRPTIDDRIARARVRAAEHRYRAVYLSYLSKRADAVVSSVSLLGQRLKDIITS